MFREGRHRIFIDDTRFIFATNFSGNPANDQFNDNRRKACVIIPTEEQAKELVKMGIKVRTTRPRDGEEEGYIPAYFTTVILSYRDRNGELKRWPPKVHIVSGDHVREIGEEEVHLIDRMAVKNVNLILSPYNYGEKHGGEGVSLYIDTMYIEQDLDDDPYAARYRSRSENQAPDEPLPFE